MGTKRSTSDDESSVSCNALADAARKTYRSIVTNPINYLTAGIILASPPMIAQGCAQRDALRNTQYTQELDVTGFRYPDSTQVWSERADSLNGILEREWKAFADAPSAAYSPEPSETKIAHLYKIHNILNNKQNMTLHDSLVSNNRPIKSDLQSRWLQDNEHITDKAQLEAAWLTYFRSEMNERDLPRFPAFETVDKNRLPTYLTDWVDMWSKERADWYKTRENLGNLGAVGPYQVLKDFVGTLNNILYLSPLDDSEVRATLRPVYESIIPQLDKTYGTSFDKALDQQEKTAALNTLNSVSQRWSLGYNLK